MPSQKCDPIEFLIKHTVDIRDEQIPAEVMNKSQELFQDTLACILAGSTSQGIKPLFDTTQLWGGNKQATVLGFSEQTSVPFAAMVNSAMGHARDFDDTHDKALNHGCVTLVPAILALAEFLSSPEMVLLILRYTAIGRHWLTESWQNGCNRDSVLLPAYSLCLWR